MHIIEDIVEVALGVIALLLLELLFDLFDPELLGKGLYLSLNRLRRDFLEVVGAVRRIRG